MRYSKHYSKLDDEEYTTIRRYKKGRKVGDIEEEILNFRVLHRVRIERIIKLAFNDMATDLLLKDTDCKTRKDAFDLLQTFYLKPIDKAKEKLFIFYLKKVKTRKEKQENCDHNHDKIIGYFTHQGIERKGMYCLNCGLLTDYIPQYNEDDL